MHIGPVNSQHAVTFYLCVLHDKSLNAAKRGGLTVQPASEATGPSFLLIDPPALNRAMSTPLKLHSVANSY